MNARANRREFITLLGGAAAVWPLAARAQQPERMRRIGILLGLAENDLMVQSRMVAFRKGLRDLGWVESRNIQIDYRFAGGDSDRARTYAAELVKLAPDVFLANGTPVIVALRQATTSIPIVFAVLNDPVGQGFIASLARPGGNITGFTLIEFTMVGKWLEMLKAMSPDIVRASLMFNPQTSP
jgi:putative ABC transport system substrate-binding protein